MFDATPLLSLYASLRRARLGSASHIEQQSKQLLSLVSQAKDTLFGREYHFESIKSVEEFQRRVPLRTYEQFWQQYWKDRFPILESCTWPGKVPFFAVSSGTTSGKTKYIPYTAAMRRSNTKAGLDLLVHHLTNRPKSRIFAGKSFILGGSTDLIEESRGVWSGDLSGISVKTLPWWAKPYYFPPAELALIKNWEEKLDVLSKRSLDERITLLSGVPSWLLIFLKKVADISPQHDLRIADLYPHLEMLVHGGVNFAPYQKHFSELLEGSHAELREVYPASEGFVAIADRGYNEGLRLICDHGIFFEFVPVEELSSTSPRRHWLQNIEAGVNYAIVLTTCAGLWAYVLGDTVKFIETNPPRLLVTGRTSYFLSAFGEHLTGEEIEQATSFAAAEAGLSLTDYSVGAVYPERSGQLGGHLFVVEFEDDQWSGTQIERFQSQLTAKLCELNDDYDAHYAGGVGLEAPKIMTVKPGSFAEWMKSRGKLGGQHKVPRIITDQDLFRSLVKFMSDAERAE
ncbi:MAG: GH3 auxin-responsive promoter family protein [Deltaproteobacteria bacterium]|nr:GH3 auxin-responsive promoter family protein [Deltaproteobacteria bacterium]